MPGFYPETSVTPLYPVVDTGFLPSSERAEVSLDPLYPTVDTDFLPAVPQRVTATQIRPLISYVHSQNAASDIWTITHNLEFYPNVTLMDSGGSQVEGEITYLNNKQLQVEFSYEISGIAYLS